MTTNHSENEIQLIIENSNDLIAIIDQNFNIIYRNHYFKDKLGYSQEIVDNLGPMDLIHPEDYTKSISELRKVILTGKGKLEARIIHVDGHYIWFEIKGRAFLDKDGNRKGLMIAKDINERKLAELRLKNSLDSLKEMYN